MITLPEIGEEVIQAWVGTKAFQRGYKYFEDEAILNPRRRGQSLIAECQGSQTLPYRVEVHLGNDGIEWATCSCPAGEGGHCKHAAALMLAWIYAPIVFSEVPELETVLEKRPKEELITLVLQMVARHPDLEQLLELTEISGMNEGELLHPDLIIQQVRRAFSLAGNELGDNSQVAENLEQVLNLGEDFLEREDPRNAATVFQTLIDSMLSYEECLYNDESGDLTQVLAECEQGLEECLKEIDDPDFRLSLLRTMFEFYLWDVNGGERGFADETPLILVKHTTPEEKQQIVAWIKEAMPVGDDRSSQHNRRVLGGLWLNLLEGQIDDEEYLRICRETGRTQDLVERLLEIDRIDEAMEVGRREQGNHLMNMADLFEKFGYHELGLQLVKERPNSESDINMLRWLKQYYAHHNQPQEALRLAEVLFWQAQSLENYNAVLEAAEELGERSPVRERILGRLESAGNFSLMVEIYLMENDLDLALTALERVNPDLWWDRMAILRRQVAQTVEIPRPREAIRQYLLLADDLIGQRSRGSYAEAARFLMQVQKLYSGLGESENWNRLIESLRNEYNRLPAFKDELRRAGLLDVV